MNRQTRKVLETVNDRIEELEQELEAIKDEEQEKYDNMPEGIQMSERGYRFTEIIDSLENAISLLEDARISIEEAQE